MSYSSSHGSLISRAEFKIEGPDRRFWPLEGLADLRERHWPGQNGLAACYIRWSDPITDLHLVLRSLTV